MDVRVLGIGGGAALVKVTSARGVSTCGLSGNVVSESSGSSACDGRAGGAGRAAGQVRYEATKYPTMRCSQEVDGGNGAGRPLGTDGADRAMTVSTLNTTPPHFTDLPVRHLLILVRLVWSTLR